MTVTVCMNATGAVWIEDAQGALVAPCFFKTAEETEDALQALGYLRLLTAYPATQVVAGTGMDPAELGEVFLERPLVRSSLDGGATARRQACAGQPSLSDPQLELVSVLRKRFAVWGHRWHPCGLYPRSASSRSLCHTDHWLGRSAAPWTLPSRGYTRV
jgi:hypothetical protein